MTDASPPASSSFSLNEGVMLTIGFVVVSVVFAAFVWQVKEMDKSIALPMLSIAGIVLLLISLTAIAYVFGRAGLQDRTQALGLPPGSIQAVIALSLIVLFAILSVFLFTSLGSTTRKIPGLSLENRDKQIALLAPGTFGGWQKEPAAVNAAETFVLFVRDSGMDARDDVGKQLIVLIGTLMTSAVSFYFGSRAAAAGAAAVTPAAPAPGTTEPPPVISAVAPEAAVERGKPTPFTITGSGLLKATGVAFVQGNTEKLDVSTLKLSDTEATGTVIAGPGAKPGAYDAVLLVGTKEVARRRNALTVA